MLRGDFEAAWHISDAVLRQRAGSDCCGLPLHLRWVWDGTPLDGKRVLVRCYHGLGDTLQFIRFVPILARRAREVSVEAQPALLPLLRSLEAAPRLIPLGQAGSGWEAEIESMELPHALRITLASLRSDVPYLAPPPVPSRKLGRDRLLVGIVWAAGDWRPERSLPPELLAPLTRLPIALVGLQQGPARRALDPAIARVFATEIDATSSILDTAALMQQLDLIVTVDTMVAHLAGALGRKVWLLLDAGADWRWMRDRSDSPWYPTMRLFRQREPGAWGPVIEELAARLARYAQRHARNDGSTLPVLQRARWRCRWRREMAEHKTARSHITTDHETIREWAEGRGGKPAAVKETHRGKDPGIIRIIFPRSRYAEDDSLEEISWDEFFEKFDEAKLALVYQEETADGQRSLFNKLIGRETAEARQHGYSHASRRGDR